MTGSTLIQDDLFGQQESAFAVYDDTPRGLMPSRKKTSAEQAVIDHAFEAINTQWPSKITGDQPLQISHPLPSAKEGERFLPWVIARSSIFTSLADKDFGQLTREKTIAYLDKEVMQTAEDQTASAPFMRPWRYDSPVALWGNGEIRATGPVLGQTDLMVLMHLLWIGRANGCETRRQFREGEDSGYIKFTLSELCRMLGKKNDYRNRQRVIQAISCMLKVTLRINSGGNQFDGAIISQFLRSKDGDLSAIKVPVAIADLFIPRKMSAQNKGSSYSNVPLQVMKKVRSSRVSWLANFLMSHDLKRFDTFDEQRLFLSMGVRLDTLNDAAKKKAIKNLRHRLKNDFNALVDFGVISRYSYHPQKRFFKVEP